ITARAVGRYELAEQVATAVETRLAAGEYDNLDEITLAELLTSHLQEASGDKHLRVRLGAGPGPGRRGPERRAGGPDGGGRPEREDGEPADREARRLKMRQAGQLDNFGIHRVERLDGNIGYLDLHRVPMPDNAGPAIAGTMELVCGTYALIIDLRLNGGGSPHGVAFWCSYLLPEEPTHLNDIFHADTYPRTKSAVSHTLRRSGTSWNSATFPRPSPTRRARRLPPSRADPSALRKP
ncbi:MAG TPA: hypothetical protein VF482_22145, partial [Trebonia sp.]